MNKQQQNLYDVLLRKVNEYCLGFAAEDVIAAIDELVDTYEDPKRISKTKAQLLVENECYQFMLHQVRYYIESKEYSLEDIVKRLNAFEIIKNKDVNAYWLKTSANLSRYNLAVGTIQELTKQEYSLLKELLGSITK